MLSGKRWPAHPHPYRDELLSSWLVRVAHANGLKVQTFCAQEFGNDHQLWNRDIDRLAPNWLIEAMSEKTGRPIKRVRETTLLGYEGKLYDKYHPAGQLRWILPLQMYHRKRRGFGLQFCPKCLAEGAEPYYRRSWRVALYTFCPKHDVMLQDRCPQCGSGIAFHRLELGRPEVIEAPSLACCWSCGFDLRESPTDRVNRWNGRTFQSWSKALRLIDKGAADSTRFDYSKVAVLHQFCSLMVSVRLAPKLITYVHGRTHQPSAVLATGRFAFELRPIGERHYVLELSWWLIGRWPSRLRAAWKVRAVRYNVLLKDFTAPPKNYLDLMDEIQAEAKIIRYKKTSK
ncbi:TniQ family protein [Jeongeupia wiesaeckerbachi]|uniref:TniQ family protein n=1 Tax=Jeongeupia wiesaeckerbachi TaxID=3051218 RepID=UPI003D8025E6